MPNQISVVVQRTWRAKAFLEQNVNNENKTQHNYKEQFSGVMIKKTALNIMINSKTKDVPSACQSLYF